MEATRQPVRAQADTVRYAHATRLMLTEHPEDQAHGHGTARIAIRAAVELGFSGYVAGRIGLAATLHDIGKQLISDKILNKPGPLEAHEWTRIRLHTILGEQMLVGEGLLDIAPWVRSHHERFDGFGYPDGLYGQEIPLESRILACADAYDAMITDRCYQAAVSPSEAREEMALASGSQFDPTVLAVVLGCTEDDVDAYGTEATRLVPG